MHPIHRRITVPCAAAVALLAAVARTQPLPGLTDRSTSDPAASSAAGGVLVAADAAIESGDAAAAVRGCIQVLAVHPYSPAVLRRLVVASGSDADSQVLWAHALYAALADARGRAKLDSTTRKLMPKGDRSIARLAAARARACQDVAKVVDASSKKGSSRSDLGSELIAQWATRLGAELLRPSPALWREYAAPWSAAAERDTFDPLVVVDAVESVMDKARDESDAALALRAAAVLRGLAAQAVQTDVRGPEPPPLDDVGQAAAEVYAWARDALRSDQQEEWTVERLRALSPAERDAFTQAHREAQRPARVVSPTGKYVIETTCGFETALGAAEMIEVQHARLARWLGVDPFDDHPGHVLIVPELLDLEEEGSPYWWSGGFQRGNETVVQFACDGLDELARSLTHELSHRFDSAMGRFQPAWLAEGKAVWAGAAFRTRTDETFMERHAAQGAITTAYNEGYTRAGKLRDLLDGSARYRDNYTAGYALFLYLSTWREGDELLFAERLETYIANGRAGGEDPIGDFASHFADGAAGRPADLEAFAEGFAKFLRGFFASSAAPWQWTYDRFTPNPPEEYVLDAPTWTWAHRAAEPYFGQGHALDAAGVLVDGGQPGAAIAALLWARRVEPVGEQVIDRLAELLRAAGHEAEAWALEPVGPLPEALERKTTHLRAYLELLRTTGGELRDRGLPRAAAVLEADAAVLGRHLGEGAVEVSLDGDLALHPFDRPALGLGSHGWYEDDLIDHDRFRAEGAWYEADDGDLHVGRSKARESSGLLERTARRRPVFVRGREWMAPGRYAIRTTVHLTTAYAEAALVFGYRRRDRFVQVALTGGDREYSSGGRSSAKLLTHVQLDVGSTFERETGLVGSATAKRVPVRSASGGFELEVLVDGARAVVRVDGKVRAVFHMPEESPIEGYVGFSAQTGAVRLVQPTVQRLDRSAAAGRSANEAPARTLEYVNSAFAYVPRQPQGAIALWIPDDAAAQAKSAAENLGQLLRADHVTQPVFVVVSATMSRAAREALAGSLRPAFPESVEVIARESATPFDRSLWVMFTDGSGVLRAADPFVPPAKALPRPTRRWAKAWSPR